MVLEFSMRRLVALALLTLQLWSLAGTALCSAGCVSPRTGGDPDCPDAATMHAAAASAAGVGEVATVSEARVSGVTDCALGAGCSSLVVSAASLTAPEFSSIPSQGSTRWTLILPVSIERSAPPLPPPNA